jgi:enoyl-CoA hydratase/carnithine racemase
MVSSFGKYGQMVSKLEEYQDRYENYEFERKDGILQVTMHTKGKDIVWGMKPDDDLGRAYEDIARDPENEVVILTGAGDTFIHYEDLSGFNDCVEPHQWAEWVLPYAIRLLNNHLDIDVPMIAAVNGPNTLHAEQAFLCDIVLASETACFADYVHFPNGLVPGDGVQIIWPMLLGMNRARYLMYTGQILSAQEALELGLVAEVLPQDELLPRAHELANQLLETPNIVRRMTRRTFSSVIRSQMQGLLDYGLSLEGISAAGFWPRDFKRAPLETDE